jgi:MFS family permease
MTHSLPLLFILSFVNGIAWGFWPVLFTVPFHLRGIRPREVAVAVSFTMMMSSSGTALGPLVAGFIQEMLSDIRLSLLITSFFGLTLTISGLLLPFGPRELEPEPAPATGRA